MNNVITLGTLPALQPESLIRLKLKRALFWHDRINNRYLVA